MRETTRGSNSSWTMLTIRITYSFDASVDSGSCIHWTVNTGHSTYISKCAQIRLKFPVVPFVTLLSSFMYSTCIVVQLATCKQHYAHILWDSSNSLHRLLHIIERFRWHFGWYNHLSLLKCTHIHLYTYAKYGETVEWWSIRVSCAIVSCLANRNGVRRVFIYSRTEFISNASTKKTIYV